MKYHFDIFLQRKIFSSVRIRKIISHSERKYNKNIRFFFIRKQAVLLSIGTSSQNNSFWNLFDILLMNFSCINCTQNVYKFRNKVVSIYYKNSCFFSLNLERANVSVTTKPLATQPLSFAIMTDVSASTGSVIPVSLVSTTCLGLFLTTIDCKVSELCSLSCV